jgi:hypothetical protein
MMLLERAPRRTLFIGRQALRAYFHEVLQSGSALALASIVLIVILGGISFNGPRAVVVGTPLDPASITAEAQAIDIQVQLSGLEYAYDGNIPPAGETTVSGRPKVEFKASNPILGTIADPKSPASTSTPEVAGPIGIEEALEFLTQ